MEKWIESDMLSGLPIQYGDPIVAFLVAECRHRVGYSDRSSFPDEKWQPISMPIRGTYDGYGGIENIENYKELNTALRKLQNDQAGNIKFHNFKIRQISQRKLRLKHGASMYEFVPQQRRGEKTLEITFFLRDEFDFILQTPICVETIAKYRSLVQQISNKEKIASQTKSDEWWEVIHNIVCDYQKLGNFIFPSANIPRAVQILMETAPIRAFNFEQVAALMKFIENMRMQWMPTSGYRRKSLNPQNAPYGLLYYNFIAVKAGEIWTKNS